MKPCNLVFLLFFLVACREEKKIPAQPQIASTTPEKKLPVKKEIAKIAELDQHFKPDYKQTPWQGNICSAVKWTDARGENILLVSYTDDSDWGSKYPKMESLAKKNNDCSLAQLFAYHYIFNDSLKKWKSYWTVNDYEFHCTDAGLRCFPQQPVICDPDSDGVAETIFAYYTSYNPVDFSYSVKLFYHVGKQKLKLTGNMGRIRNEFAEFKNMDTLPHFSTDSNNFRKSHLQKSKEIWQRLFGLRDSLDDIQIKAWRQTN